METRVPILPVRQSFYGTKDTLDLKAICVFAATGFFLDQDTYYEGLKVLKPGHDYQLEEDRSGVLKEKQWFRWHYAPRDISLKQATEEFTELFEGIVNEQVGDRQVILPLSGGLDSRTQAAALHRLKKNVHAYSYAFENGHDETYYGRKIARECNFPCEEWVVPKAYLWSQLENLASVNGCYSEFTHPRQAAFTDRFAVMGDVFSLGHWGDVLFDDMGIAETATLQEQTELIVKKIVKRGGMELAQSLWVEWKLEGDFSEYLYERIRSLVKGIDIPDSANARVRAFKSLYWAPRWTSINLAVFAQTRPITLPYYDNRMCEFVCTVPEELLANRKIQIAYLKMRSPELARIMWQENRPFNLYNYKYNKAPINWPYRAYSKLKRELNSKKMIQRNWELQFLGQSNDKQLHQHLLENEGFTRVVSRELIEKFYSAFKSGDQVTYSHPVSMLLTLSVFMCKQSNA